MDKQFIRFLFLISIAAVAPTPGISQTTEPSSGSERPNIVFFLIDDMGYSDIGCYGSDYYETPHIDRLAEQGMKFTSNYAACTVCSPTRASLLTGKYPARLRITHAIPIEGHLRMKDSTFRDADYVKDLPLEEVTIAEALQEANYATAFMGKWHVCWDDDYLSQYHGFETNIGAIKMGNPGDYFYPYKGRWRMTPDHPWTEWQIFDDGEPGEYLTDRMGEEAVKYIEAHKDEPFFLYLSHYAVHTPIQAKKDLIAKYEAKPKDETRGHTHPEYAAMIESVDDSVGRVMETLERLGLEDNTIVIFTSDNGGADFVTSNYPWRGCKGNYYEGGIRVPAIFKWPGVTRPGTVSDEVIISPDYYPTILEMAGLPLRPEQHLDGLSFAGALRDGARLDREAVFWDFPHYIAKRNIEMLYPTSTVRKGPWKLIQSLEDGSVELFNLKDDPQETTDLSLIRHDKVSELRAEIVQHRIETKAQNLRPR